MSSLSNLFRTYLGEDDEFEGVALVRTKERGAVVEANAIAVPVVVANAVPVVVVPQVGFGCFKSESFVWFFFFFFLFFFFLFLYLYLTMPF
jgi:hypothetical protein